MEVTQAQAVYGQVNTKAEWDNPQFMRSYLLVRFAVANHVSSLAR
jgi:hypothetical protein